MLQDPKLEFKYELDAFDPKDPSVLSRPEYEIECNFSILVDGKLLCHEIYVSPVEFAVFSTAWMHSLKRQPSDLVYQPEGYAEDFLFKFVKADDGWRIVPFEPKYQETRVFSESCLVEAISKCLHNLTEELKQLTNGRLDISSRLKSPSDS